MNANPQQCSVTGCEKRIHGRQLCRTHYARWAKHGTTEPPLKPTSTELFWSHVDKDGSTPLTRTDLGPCWLWTAATTRGYGRFGLDGRMRSAHSVSFEMACGPVPEGAQLDHLCHDPEVCTPGPACPHRRCVNPSHLAAATPRENTLRGGSASAANARKSSCLKGHPFNETNTYRHNGYRICKTCQQEHGRAHRRRKKAAGETRQQVKPGPYEPAEPCTEGSTGKYWLGCRCERCRAAYSAYRADYRRRKAISNTAPTRGTT